MTLVFALNELFKACRIVTEGVTCMVRQRKVVDQLEHEGYDTLDAILLLEYLEENIAHRNRVEKQVLG
jgi:hypothetical protein